MDFELSEELKMIQSLARDFVEQQLKPLERDILGRAADLSDARSYLPAEIEAELIKMVKGMGLWGAGIPVELGGAGLSCLGVCLVEEELAGTVVPFHFGDVTPILFDGNAEQRKKFLLPAINNEKRPYLALMENDGKTALSGIKTKAEKVDGHYVINGEKLSLSRKGGDYFAIVFAMMEKGMTCFLVDKDTPGFSVSTDEKARTGWLSQVREPLTLVFKDCRVSKENMLGEAGKAFSLGKKWLPQRRIVRGARCVGIARRLLDEAAIRARTAEEFGQPLYRRSNIQAALTDIAINIHAARLMVHEAASRAESGKTIFQDAATVKLYTTQMLRAVVDRVAHVFNGPPHIDGLPMEWLCQHAVQSGFSDMVIERQRSIIARDILKGLKV